MPQGVQWGDDDWAVHGAEVRAAFDQLDSCIEAGMGTETTRPRRALRSATRWPILGLELAQRERFSSGRKESLLCTN